MPGNTAGTSAGSAAPDLTPTRRALGAGPRHCAIRRRGAAAGVIRPVSATSPRTESSSGLPESLELRWVDLGTSQGHTGEAAIDVGRGGHGQAGRLRQRRCGGVQTDSELGLTAAYGQIGERRDGVDLRPADAGLSGEGSGLDQTLQRIAVLAGQLREAGLHVEHGRQTERAPPSASTSLDLGQGAAGGLEVTGEHLQLPAQQPEVDLQPGADVGTERGSLTEPVGSDPHVARERGTGGGQQQGLTEQLDPTDGPGALDRCGAGLARPGDVSGGVAKPRERDEGVRRVPGMRRRSRPSTRSSAARASPRDRAKPSRARCRRGARRPDRSRDDRSARPARLAGSRARPRDDRATAVGQRLEARLAPPSPDQRSGRPAPPTTQRSRPHRPNGQGRTGGSARAAGTDRRDRERRPGTGRPSRSARRRPRDGPSPRARSPTRPSAG